MFVWEASYTPGELNNKLMSVISAQRLPSRPCPRQSKGSLAHQANAHAPKQDGSALARLPSQMKPVTV
jgi:hypothetical protein